MSALPQAYLPAHTSRRFVLGDSKIPLASRFPVMGICMRALRDSWSLCGFNWEVNYVWAPRWRLGGLGLWSAKGEKVALGGAGNFRILPSLLKKVSINAFDF